MTTQLLICDDSAVARKQTAKSLPADLDVEINFAKNGQEGLDMIRQGKGDLMLLDLNMPVLDGYGALEVISKEDLPTMVVVVSGDVQPEARARVMKMGALDFIRKPIDAKKLTEILERYGLVDRIPDAVPPKPSQPTASYQTSTSSEPAQFQSAARENELDPELRDVLQEISNVAMGQAGELLARLLNAFVKLPIPNVNLIEVSELHMALKSIEEGEQTSGICQGFIGAGVAGEALLILNDSSFNDAAKLLKYDGELTDNLQLELLMDVANILIGSCLKGISGQLDMPFSQGHPVVLGQHCSVSELIKANKSRWSRTLAIEISYGIENYKINCDLLFLFTEDSLSTIKNKVAFLLE